MSAMKADAIRMPSPKAMHAVAREQRPAARTRPVVVCVRRGRAHGHAHGDGRGGGHGGRRARLALHGCARARGATARPCPAERKTPRPPARWRTGRAPAWLSNASGSKCMKAVASKAPAARLSRCCGPTPSWRPPRPIRINSAAAHTLPMPAASVAIKIAINVIAISAYQYCPRGIFFYQTSAHPSQLR